MACDGKPTTVERYAGFTAYCTCGNLAASEPTRERIRKAVIDHVYGTPKERNARLGF